ncbi:D-amino-acid oxidase, partial [Erwinia amylovora]|nr:D-amino-acid oxidase [Erwinia amylovora]
AVSGRGRLEPGVQSKRYARQFYPTYRSRRKDLTIAPGIGPFLRGPESLARWQMDGVSPFEQVRILDPRPDMALVEEGLRAMRNEFPQMAA